MSVIIALKHKNGILIGSDKQGTIDNIKEHDCTKIQKSCYSETAIGMCGWQRDLDIIFCNIEELMDYKDILDEVKLDKRYLVNNIVTKIFNILERFKRVNQRDGICWLDSTCLVCSNDKIFRIGFYRRSK